ncbi:LuxR C-terminal-related transcriptional regulator [Glutamicibacter sp.]|uniref:helix-turn-helix transcriptional regulator n=1 Tax=Glutamicibacter sp. TaxID=1931995 RepID=UPI0028BD59FE|nr:LuxR C-terminal-related transcriptional regulator [Glutamicibacter sp.]
MAEQYELLIDFAIENFTELYSQHRLDSAHLINKIPASAQEAHPELAIIGAVGQSVIHPHRPIDLAEVQLSLQKIAEASAGSEDPIIRLRTAGLQLSVMRVLMLADQAVEAARHWERVVDVLSPIVNLAKKKMYFVFAVQCVAAYAHGGSFAEAISAARRLDQDENRLRHLHVRSLVSLSHALNGDMVSARNLIHHFDDGCLPQNWQGSYNAIGYHVSSALLAIEDANPNAALARLDDLNEFLHVVDHWAFILIVRARALIFAGDPVTAADEIRNSMMESTSQRAGSSALDMLNAAYLDLLNAAELVERAARFKETVKTSLPAFNMAVARAAMNHDEITALKLARTEWDSNCSLRLHAESLLVEAIAYHRLGLAELADESTVKLAATVKHSGLPSVLAYGPRPETNFLLQRHSPVLGDQLRNFAHGPDQGIKPKVTLTEMQLKILSQLVTHPSFPKLAESLFISPNTVKTHLRNIYLKLGVKNRAEAVQTAMQLGLLD